MGIRDVGGILQRGGTILQTARSDEFRTERGQQKAVREMNNVGMDALVVIGGDAHSMAPANWQSAALVSWASRPVSTTISTDPTCASV
jgi:6-phosphofructokinase